MVTSSVSPRAVIFDIGGVLVRTEDWSGRRKWENHLGLPEWALSTLVFECAAAIQASTGRGHDEAIWQFVGEKCGLDPHDLSILRADFWSGDRLNRELADYVNQLRPQYTTGILSNAWPEMRDLNVDRFGLKGLVDETVYSFETGILKPDPRSYLHVLRKLKVQANEAIFVDDAERNILAAQVVGMRTVLFKKTTQAITDLNYLLGARHGGF